MYSPFQMQAGLRGVVSVFLLLVVALLSACQGGDIPTEDSEVNQAKVSSVSIGDNSGTVITLNIGDSMLLSAKAKFDDGTTQSPAANQVVWSAVPTSLVSIDGNGFLKALKAGTASVTGRYQGIASNPVQVKIAEDPTDPTCSLASLRVTGPANGELAVGASFTYDAVGVCSNGDETDVGAVTWSGNNATVASVSSSGAVNAKKAGVVVVMAKATGLSQSTTLTVVDGENNQPGSMALSVVTPDYSYPLDFCPGKQLVLRANYTVDSVKTDVSSTASWSSSASATVSVGANGQLTAKAVGTAVITATYQGVPDTETVTVGECGLSFFVKKPAEWSAVNIYSWDDSVTPVVEPTQKWPGAVMASDGDDWYKVRITGRKSVNVIFNDGGKTEQTVDYKGRTATGWCTIIRNGKAATCDWADRDPRKPSTTLDLTVSPNDTTFTDTIAASISWNNSVASYCRYTIDGSDPAVSGTNCQSSVTLGSGLTVGQSVKLRVCASDNATMSPCDARTYTKAAASAASAFTWDNATVYFVVTDRFYNGDQSNDKSYGRNADGDQNVGTWHGGDLVGLTTKINEGYFTNLGVNALWITAPYEQIHGWVKGGNSGDFKHYAYHGYWVKDYTVLDKNMGTINASRDDMRDFVDAAHAKGIRVLFDIVMNHPGYYTPQDLAEDGIQVLKRTDWQNATVSTWDSYIDFASSNFSQGWGPAWVRAGLPGHDPAPCGNVDGCPEQYTLNYLPDLKTESGTAVDLPPFIKRKADTKAKAIAGYTPRKYLVKWLSDWVRNYGVDGFRCDTVKHVEKEAWAELKSSSAAALREWKQSNPSKKLDNNEFWMVGEFWNHGPSDRAGNGVRYLDYGFDAMINFSFQGSARGIAGNADGLGAIDGTYGNYASTVNGSGNVNVLSYISSHDKGLFSGDGDREKQKRAGSLLLMTPGAVQIYYGDENARRNGPSKSDADQASRSDMAFGENSDVLSHWQKLGKFRQQHAAVGAGQHKSLGTAPYHFARTLGTDKVVVAFGAKGNVTLSVSGVFDDGTKLTDSYTGQSVTVTGGKVSIAADANGVVLLSK